MFFQKMDVLLDMLKERYGTQAVEDMLAGRRSRMVISITFYPDINEYMGRITPQIIITHYR